jgi:lipopolysaccharide export system permease protein
MRRLRGYIFSTVLMAILLVLLIITGVDVLASLIDQREDITDSYGIVQILTYVLLGVPGRLFIYLPFASLIGCLAGLGVLANSSELTVMRAAGVSIARILWYALRPALLLIVIGLAMEQWLVPPAKQFAESYRSLALHEDGGGISKYGLWHREGSNFIHFNAVEPNGVLYGVAIYEFAPDSTMRRAAYAQRAIYNNQTWILEDLRETRFLGEQNEQSFFESKVWETELSPQLLNVLILEPMDLAMTDLWRYANYLNSQELSAQEYFLAFWTKLLQPLAVVSLVLLAGVTIFGPLREATMGFRVTIGVVIGIAFRTFQDMLGPASLVFGFSPLLAAALPIVLSLCLAIFFLMRRSS